MLDLVATIQGIEERLNQVKSLLKQHASPRGRQSTGKSRKQTQPNLAAIIRVVSKLSIDPRKSEQTPSRRQQRRLQLLQKPLEIANQPLPSSAKARQHGGQ